VINLQKPKPMSLKAVASGLSNKRRWCGLIPVSIAAHSVAVSVDLELMGYRPEIQLMGLLHDAPEAPLCDMPTSLKPFTFVQIDERLVSWSTLEDMWAEVLLPALGAGWPLPPEVKVSDRRAMSFEAFNWGLDVPRKFGEPSKGFSKQELSLLGKKDFINRYKELTNA
tara:strand:+ start:2006 stop:2509 length:504 start_codon:yes stop_codon:yes gene_type:complete